MINLKKTLLSAVILSSIAITGQAKTSGTVSAKAKSYVPVISKGFQHSFWLTVRDGSAAAAKKCGVKTSFVGPSAETQIAQQINMVENAMMKHPQGIILAPLDAKALVPIINQAKRKHVPVITFDSGLASKYPVSFVATNNQKAGALAAQHMIKLLKAKGWFKNATIGIIAHNAGTTSTIDRVKGFVDYIHANASGIKILGVKYSDGDHDKARSMTIDMLRAHPHMRGIYATNEGAAIGMGLGIATAGKAKQLVKMGFDRAEGTIKQLKQGNLDGFVAQDPFQIGYQSMMLMCKTLKGESVPAVVDIPTQYINIKNVDKAK